MPHFSGQTAAAIVISSLAAAAWSHDLTGDWTLQVEDLNHKVVASAKVRFTDESARSCLAGGWRKVAVTSPSTTNKRFFPVSEPLSYRVDGTSLVIGRNEVCDAYLHLTGPIGKTPIQGDYAGVGISGGNKSGFFTLSRSQ